MNCLELLHLYNATVRLIEQDTNIENTKNNYKKYNILRELFNELHGDIPTWEEVEKCSHISNINL